MARYGSVKVTLTTARDVSNVLRFTAKRQESKTPNRRQ